MRGDLSNYKGERVSIVDNVFKACEELEEEEEKGAGAWAELLSSPLTYVTPAVVFADRGKCMPSIALSISE